MRHGDPERAEWMQSVLAQNEGPPPPLAASVPPRAERSQWPGAERALLWRSHSELVEESRCS